MEVKRRAVEEAIADGADEVDYVVNIGMLKGGLLDYVVREAREVLKGAGGRVVKAIIEVGYLTVEEMESVAVRLAEAGVHYVKTCTGYGPRGVTVEDVFVLKRALRGRAGIKAAGGVRDLRAAQALIDAGADIIGTSAARRILRP
jgi:deoxyribose-phosphate aldolase